MPIGKTLASAELGLALAIAACVAYGQPPDAPVQTVRISGWVKDKSSSPVSYEAVHLRLPGAREFLVSIPTDSEGRFTFPPVQPERYELLVHVPNTRPLVQLVDVSAGKDVDVGVLSLEIVSFCDQVQIHVSTLHLAFDRVFHPVKRCRVSGRVIDSHGLPVANAIVHLIDPCFGFGARTAPNGTFLVRRVFRGSYQLRVLGSGFLPVDQTIEAGTQKEDTNLGTIAVKR